MFSLHAVLIYVILKYIRKVIDFVAGKLIMPSVKINLLQVISIISVLVSHQQSLIETNKLY